VQDLQNSPDDEKIIRATINMSHELGFKVVTEGVENETVVELLKAQGCDYAQGFLYARPMPAAQALIWLENYYETLK